MHRFHVTSTISDQQVPLNLHHTQLLHWFYVIYSHNCKASPRHTSHFRRFLVKQRLPMRYADHMSVVAAPKLHIDKWQHIDIYNGSAVRVKYDKSTLIAVKIRCNKSGRLNGEWVTQEADIIMSRRKRKYFLFIFISCNDIDDDVGVGNQPRLVDWLQRAYMVWAHATRPKR